jgi:hypothetical protein
LGPKRDRVCESKGDGEKERERERKEKGIEG